MGGLMTLRSARSAIVERTRTEEHEMEVETDTLREAASPYEQWEAGELSAQAAATAIAEDLIAEIEPAEQALEAQKKLATRSWASC